VPKIIAFYAYFIRNSSCVRLSCIVNLTSISSRRWTRVTRCLARIVRHTVSECGQGRQLNVNMQVPRLCQVSSTDGGRQFIAIIVRLDLVDRTRCDDRRAVAKVRHVALTALLAGLYLGKFEAYILSRPTSLCRNSN